MNAILSKIRTRGHWEVNIKPTEFLDNRIESLGRCKEIVRSLSVQFRGWDYPHYDTINMPTNGINYAEQSFEWEHYIEFWRYYQSGQFIHFFGMWEDWQDQVTRWERLTSGPGEVLSIVGAVYTFTEIYEFASRLAAKTLLGNNCKISVALHKTRGRTLRMLDRGRILSGTYTTTLDSIPRDVTVSVEELMGKSVELALDHTIWVFQRFNWDNVPRTVLQEDQRKLIERRF